MKRLLSILSIWAFTGVVSGAAEPDLLFQSADPFDITLNAPFRLIDRERDSELEYDGTLSYTDDSGEPVLLDVTLSVRGNWRLQKGNCRYSQLWVNLRRGQVPGTIFENQNRLKLVVQCDRSDKYASYIVKEEMLYQICCQEVNNRDNFVSRNPLHPGCRLVGICSQSECCRNKCYRSRAQSCRAGR